MSEYDKMLSGAAYFADDPELVAMRNKARRLIRHYNNSDPDEGAHRVTLLREIFGSIGANPYVEPDFRCDYGINIHAGKNLFLNFSCVLLDVNNIFIGDNVMMGPGVHIYTAYHPIDPVDRCAGIEFGMPVKIGNNVWIGGRTVINPGVTIGDNVVIGSGSVVTRNIPDNHVAVGNPCRPLRKIEPTEHLPSIIREYIG